MPKLDLLCATIWKIYGESPNDPPPLVAVNRLVVRGLKLAEYVFPIKIFTVKTIGY